ncbi:hypothetical protein C7974DRAFT_393193 [Boeremia exigua]|uniref:uncharacterized protein n=1 Tax=Boeremia exigua TaxID=749465 RepID=UPI001E8E4594|nr:uncharacterized protein C7974DRAFT_393193 [Boeremia exigua]KAH6633639.1 hypothetical protein C7974DRAFT_393193 [Boeremia exigua]
MGRLYVHVANALLLYCSSLLNALFPQSIRSPSKMPHITSPRSTSRTLLIRWMCILDACRVSKSECLPHFDSCMVVNWIRTYHRYHIQRVKFPLLEGLARRGLNHSKQEQDMSTSTKP